jgi:L-alanine-DL-glutamate epimerase-like enolase superfamily enzyme
MTKTFRLKLGTILHNQPLGIASAAQVRLGAARASVLGQAMGLFGHVMLEDDLIVDPLDYSGGFVRVPEQTGLGVALDVDALDRYATAAPVVLERSR